MTDETTFRLIGLDRLARTLKTARDDVGALKEAHYRAGDMVAREAAAKAPRRSGSLAGTIRASRQARRAQVVAGGRSVPYANPIHWGWPARGIAANPFLSDAAQATESRWVPIYLRDVQAAVDNVKGA